MSLKILSNLIFQLAAPLAVPALEPGTVVAVKH